MEEKIDYYKIGSKDNIVVSSSSMKYLMPEEGGSPVAFLNFFEENKEEELEKASLRRGKLVHLWHEDKDKFIVSEIEKPSEKMGQVADKLIDMYRQGNEIDENTYLYVLNELNYSKNWKDATRVAKAKEACDAYIFEIINAEREEKVYISKTDKEIILNACEAIEKHPVANKLLFGIDNDFSDIKTLREQEVFWETNVVQVLGSEEIPVTIQCKAKLDHVTFDFEKKVIRIVDLKTTSAGVYTYYKAFESYRTYRQLMFYCKAAMAFAAQQGWKVTSDWKYELYVVAVETNMLQQCAVWSVPFEWRLRGNNELREFLRRIKYHLATKQWSYSIEEVQNNYILEIPEPKKE